MAILKCKMCGGDILLSEDKTTGTCDHCGSVMTFPRVSDEQKLNLYNRANHFRRQNEFDKAIAAYERILEQDDADAEAHWGAVLSRYGIEYVEDPVTHERIPTCHRVQPTSILSDEDYLAALEHAPDTASRDLYEQEARRIADIQKGILAISSQEKPYDVFICYKETDDSGQRTKDSALAQEIYYQLTNEGYKVFFSRITLEDKLGTEYEPYIFAALNSAKVMLVIGTKPEYLNAVWVKNEWSRYLALMRQDRSRLLIPCYRDMDPYDLPEELSALQSQDMGKIGFIQDLIRGVKKVLDAKKPEAPKAPVMQQVVSAGANVDNLMKRVRLFLEDGDFSSANEYLDKVLDENAEYAPAYIGKVCTALGFRREEDLAGATFLYGEHPDWKKALRFATEQQKATYEGYYQQVEYRVAGQIWEYAFDCATEMAVNPRADAKALVRELDQYKAACSGYGKNRADGSRRANWEQNEKAFRQSAAENEPGEVTEKGYQAAAEMFRAIEDEEANARAEECLALAEQARQKAVYQEAVEIRSREQRHPSGLEKAAKLFLSVPDYKDAKEQAQACLDAAESIRAGLYTIALNALNEANDKSIRWFTAKEKLAVPELTGYRDVEQLRVKAAQQYDKCVAAEQEARLEEQRKAEAAAAKKKRNIILAIIFTTLATAIVVAGILVVTQVIIPGNNYTNAIALRQAGKYEEAIEAFTALGGYSDAAEQIKATYYAEGEAKRTAQDWDGAVTAFGKAGAYGDAMTTRIMETRYAEGEAKRAAQDWDGAVTAFEKAGAYSDAQTQILETIYQHADALEKVGQQDAAKALFISLGNYKDSYERAYRPYHDQGISLLAAQDWDGAVAAFMQAGTYEDAQTWILATRYAEGKAKLAVQDWDGAIAAFMQAGTYNDAQTQIQETNYQHADALEKAGQQDAAKALFVGLGSYKDSYERACKLYYDQGISLQATQDWDGAIVAFMQAGDYSDTQMQLVKLFEQAGEKTFTSFAALAYSKIGNRNKAIALWYETGKNSVAAGFEHTVGLKADGTVVAVGFNDSGRCDVSGWTDIVAVAAGAYHTVGLKADGTVVAVGNNEYGQCDVSDWTDIVAVAVGKSHTVGLKADGTVVAVGDNDDGQCKVSGWTDIVAVAAGAYHTMGLKTDGTVVTVGWNTSGQCDVGGWTDIVAVAAGDLHAVGLKADGTVVAVGNNGSGQCDVSGWTDIVAVAAGYGHTVGLKADSTVVAVGQNFYGQCNVSGWTDIVAVAAGDGHTVGLKADGTVVAVGRNDDGQCNVSGWSNIKVP